MKKNSPTSLNPSPVRKLFFGLLLMGLLAACSAPKSIGSASKTVRVLIVGGGSSHDFNRWFNVEDSKTLSRDGLATVTYTGNIDSISYYLPNIDVLYLSNNQPVKDVKIRQGIFDFANAGKGLILGHPALWYNWKDWPEYNLQLVSGGSRGHDKYGDFQVDVVNPGHPVTKGVQQRFTIKDERYYYNVDSTGPGREVLANNSVAGSDKIYPSVFVIKHPKARIVGIALGHDAPAHELLEYQLILRNAVEWASRK
ncbi:MAG: ThuA domain-containing protein [Chitinophagaceae bacterium]